MNLIFHSVSMKKRSNSSFESAIINVAIQVQLALIVIDSTAKNENRLKRAQKASSSFVQLCTATWYDSEVPTACIITDARRTIRNSPYREITLAQVIPAAESHWNEFMSLSKRHGALVCESHPN